MKSVIFSAIAVMASFACANAQEESSHLAVQVGAGFTQGVGRTGTYTDTGWNISTGVGYNFNAYVGALVDVNVNAMGITPATLNGLGAPTGNLTSFSATLDPIVHLMPHGHFDVYVTGGGGEFRLAQWFQQPVTTPLGVGSSPILFRNSSSEALYSDSVNKPGYDVGIGIAMGTKWRGKFYAEAKYDHVFLNGFLHTDYLPVTFGFRW